MSQNKLWVSYVGVAEIEKKRLNAVKEFVVRLSTSGEYKFLMEIIELMSFLPRS